MLFLLGFFIGAGGSLYGAYWIRNKLNAIHTAVQQPTVVQVQAQQVAK